MSLIKLEPFENVSAAGTAFLKTTRLWPFTLEFIAIELGGGPAPTKAQLTSIKVRFGQKQVWEITGAQLLSVNLFDGRPNTATVLLLPFANFRAATLEQRFIGAPDFGQLGVREVTLEIAVAGGVAPTLVAWASVQPSKLLTPAQNLLFRALLRTPLNYAAAVVDQPINLSYAAAGGGILRAAHVFSAVATRLKVKRDGLDIFEDIGVALNNGILDELGHDPQPNIFHLVFNDDDNELKNLSSIRDDGQGGSLIPTQFLLTTNAAINADAIADAFVNLNGL